MSPDQIIRIQNFLETALTDATLFAIAQKAIHAIKGKKVLDYNKNIEDPISSKSIAKIYTLRNNMGYFSKKKIHGLNETIEGLSREDRLVNTFYLQVEEVLVSIWVEISTQRVLGIIVFESLSD